MRTVKVTNFKGTEYEGAWNEKTYSSKVEGQPELIRIYLSNEEIHITEEEYSKLIEIPEKLQIVDAEKKINQTREQIKKMSLAEKFDALVHLFDDEEVSGILNDMMKDTKTIISYSELMNTSAEHLTFAFRQTLLSNMTEAAIEAKTKKVEVDMNEKLESVFNRLQKYSKSEDTYVADWRGTKLTNKMSRNEFFKEATGVIYKEYREKENENDK